MKKIDSHGFTIVELLIAIAISAVITMVLLTLSINFAGDISRARITADLATESQILLRSIVEDTRLADSLSSTNSIADANAPVGGWITNDPSNVLIIDTPAIDSARNIIYDSSTTLPYSNEIIYYSSGSAMYRRALKNSAATGSIAVTTCPPASASSSCPADKLFTKYLTDLSFTFFDENNATTANATLARSVQITVSVKRKVFGRDVTFNNTIRTTMRNR